MKEILLIVFVIIADLIGAGFASGQEMYSFFFAYGTKGLLGLMVMSALIAVLIYKILRLICVREVDTYDEFLGIFIKNKKATKIINIILNVLLVITFYIMIAGFGAYFEQEIDIAKLIGSTFLAVMCLIVFFTSVKGVLKVSEYLVPFLIICIIAIGVKAMLTLDVGSVNIPILKKGWLLSSVVYCSYNIILLVPILISLRNQIKEQSKIKYIALISGIVIFVLSLSIYVILAKANVDWSQIEMPMVYAVRTQFPGFSNIYTFIILASIFTTAITVGTGILQNVRKNKKSYTQAVIILCITSLLFSNIGFSNLINYAYPLFGYLGIVQIILILSKNICKK